MTRLIAADRTEKWTEAAAALEALRAADDDELLAGVADRYRERIARRGSQSG